MKNLNCSPDWSLAEVSFYCCFNMDFEYKTFNVLVQFPLYCKESCDQAHVYSNFFK
jgi:hypothetical protein